MQMAVGVDIDVEFQGDADVMPAAIAFGKKGLESGVEIGVCDAGLNAEG